MYTSKRTRDRRIAIMNIVMVLVTWGAVIGIALVQYA